MEASQLHRNQYMINYNPYMMKLLTNLPKKKKRHLIDQEIFEKANKFWNDNKHDQVKIDQYLSLFIIEKPPQRKSN